MTEQLAATVTVVEHKGNVLIGTPGDGGRPIFALDPEGARQLSEAIARCGFKARFGVDTTPNGVSAVRASMREGLVNRVNIMLRSLQEQHKPRSYIASRIVDEIMGRVL